MKIQVRTRHNRFDLDIVRITGHSRDMYFPEGSFRTYSESLKQFYELCLLYDPVERPSADQLINHSFIKLGRRSGICLTELLLPVIPYDAELDSPSHSNREFGNPLYFFFIFW